MAASGSTMGGKRPGMAHWPLTHIIVGAVLLALWVVFTTVEIKTSEVYIMGGKMPGGVSLSPDLGVLGQPFALMGINGAQVLPVLVLAYSWAWILEMLYLITVLGLGIIFTHIKTANRFLAIVFVAGTFGFIIWDTLANYHYATLPSGQWPQLGAAAILTFAVAFFGVAGGILIEHGIRHW